MIKSPDPPTDLVDADAVDADAVDADSVNADLVDTAPVNAVTPAGLSDLGSVFGCLNRAKLSPAPACSLVLNTFLSWKISQSYTLLLQTS